MTSWSDLAVHPALGEGENYGKAMKMLASEVCAPERERERERERQRDRETEKQRDREREREREGAG